MESNTSAFSQQLGQPRHDAGPRPTKGPRAGVYVHFPWCLAKCPYCDFVSYVGTGEASAAYATAVIRELEARAADFAGRRVESIFFGGGTPSLWRADELSRVLDAIRTSPSFNVAADAEVTVECNPTSLDAVHARALADVGVNRLSIGVQSLSDARLRVLGRLHDAAGGLRAVREAKRVAEEVAGTTTRRGHAAFRVSADLIFGLPDQTPEDASAEAAALVDLGLDHLSCYQLTIEPGTRFGELARKGRLPLADDGAVAESFLAIDDALERRGLRHYEISNYARPGHEARHNLGYWRGDEYLGLGCGAFGFVRRELPLTQTERPAEHAIRPGRGDRWRNVVDPEAYIDAAGVLAALVESTEPLDGETLLRERIMLGLRLADGLDLEANARELGVDGWTPERERAAARLQARGRVVRDGTRAHIPRRAWLWANDTSAKLF